MPIERNNRGRLGVDWAAVFTCVRAPEKFKMLSGGVRSKQGYFPTIDFKQLRRDKDDH